VFPAAPPVLDAFVVDTTGGAEALRLTTELRAAGLTADRAYENRSMKAQMRVADRSGAAIAVIIGSNELAEDAVTVRPLRNDDGQQTIARSTLIDYLKKARP
jgi:histidyl-tRNA synthetase